MATRFTFEINPTTNMVEIEIVTPRWSWSGGVSPDYLKDQGFYLYDALFSVIPKRFADEIEGELRILNDLFHRSGESGV